MRIALAALRVHSWKDVLVLFRMYNCICPPSIPEGPGIIPSSVCLSPVHAYILQVVPTRQRADEAAAAAAEGRMLAVVLLCLVQCHIVLGHSQGFDIYAY